MPQLVQCKSVIEVLRPGERLGWKGDCRAYNLACGWISRYIAFGAVLCQIYRAFYHVDAVTCPPNVIQSFM